MVHVTHLAVPASTLNRCVGRAEGDPICSPSWDTYIMVELIILSDNSMDISFDGRCITCLSEPAPVFAQTRCLLDLLDLLELLDLDLSSARFHRLLNTRPRAIYAHVES